MVARGQNCQLCYRLWAQRETQDKPLEFGLQERQYIRATMGREVRTIFIAVFCVHEIKNILALYVYWQGTLCVCSPLSLGTTTCAQIWPSFTVLNGLVGLVKKRPNCVTTQTAASAPYCTLPSVWTQPVSRTKNPKIQSLWRCCWSKNEAWSWFKFRIGGEHVRLRYLFFDRILE